MSGFKSSPLPPITETGMRGFLKWYQREQPDLYKKVAPTIAAVAPSIFSDYNQSVTASIRNVSAGVGQRARTKTMGRLGQDPTDYGYNLNPDLTVSDSSITGVGVDVPSATLDALTLQTPPIDTADAANQGPVLGTVTQAVAQAIAGVTGAYATVVHQQTANAITQLQLQRASQNLPPLNIGMNANGIPTFSAAAIGGSSVVLGLGLLIGAYLLFGRGGRSHA